MYISLINIYLNGIIIQNTMEVAMKNYLFDHYYEYNELSKTLQELQNSYPELIKVESIATSSENREVFACTITDFSTGDALSKPAFYADANFHAGEVTGSMAAIHLIITLTQGFKEDEAITKLLQEHTIYVIPRVSPDGAETYLTSYEKLRSVNRPYPLQERAAGLHPCDMDGDDVIRIMRVKSDTGAWKAMAEDERIMIKRSPSDIVGSGTFYNVYPEGFIVDYDGVNVYLAEEKWGLDFNRNFPFGWFPEARQPGAGKYPLSNIETKAVADFVINHPNICAGITFHTSGGCYIYPPGIKPEKDADARDMKMFREIGKMVTEETGYPCMNIFDSFLSDTVNYSSGAFDDWMYYTQGIPTYTAELWDLPTRAGVEMIYPRSANSTDDEKAKDMLKCFKWIDANVQTLKSGKPIKDWQEFDHPQLGLVEIGSMDFKFTWQNPPPAFLEQEVKKNTAFCLRMANSLPKLVIDEFKSELVGDDIYKLTTKFTNYGYLPTFVCNEAKTLKVDKPLLATLTFNGEVINGKAEQEVGHLEGFSGINTTYHYDNINTFKNEPLSKTLSWIVKVNKGENITLNLRNDKSGTATAAITI